MSSNFGHPKTRQKLPVVFITNYDVPWLAGYNKTGNRVYIDRRVPRKYHGYLAIHELTEQHLEDYLGLSYAEAHKLATAAEKAAVQHDGLSWADYQAFFRKLLKTTERDFRHVPPDLDLSPYTESNARELLRRMVECEPELAKQFSGDGGKL